MEPLFAIGAEQSLDQRCALALNVARQQLMHLSLPEFKALVRDQAFLLRLEPKQAVDALATLVPEEALRKELLAQVQVIVGAGDAPNAAERNRLAQLAKVLAVPTPTVAEAPGSRRASVAKDQPQPSRVAH